ncbi:outer membrane protein assembly factor BamE [Pseudomaricurvus alkylphenolicus]|jgi:outer membrane protein assembly factor BamE|uniref:outer membrane protein assembly factor BamE n=1 Tax=Pseudomaricurvus alkylphenolicus TaxID=1306991 RepID=UPI0014217536|nr:outer membrane protein assembly factor BamE [Pseudomaricurvus alkylphenolicus]NIB44612.1 outer membrane protein assembly factor BamE [Pseudomaricurvus alkylphenolicus]
MQKSLFRLLALAGLLTLGGCQYFQFPGVHKINIQQGNIVTQDMVDQLKPGMTRRQVRFVMGTPLVQDTFSPDRWDYFYSMVPARGEPTKERISIYFKDDKLTHFTGDFAPSASATTGAQ